MPTPDHIIDRMQPVNPAFKAVLDRLHAAEPKGLEFEITALREEIRQLREDLAPVPSLILTGRQVLDEFKRLNSIA